MRSGPKINWRTIARRTLRFALGTLHVVLGMMSTLLIVIGRLLILGGLQAQTLRARWHPR